MKTVIIHGIKCTPGVKIDKVSKNNSSLSEIRKKFPNVKTAHDSLVPIGLTVTAADIQGASPKDFMRCAFARAACRALNADGAFFGIKGSILVLGDAAVRFDNTATVTREMAMLDRTKKPEYVAPGDYRLSAKTPTRRLGAPWKRKRKDRRRLPKKNSGVLIEPKKLPNHYTLEARNEKDLALK